MVADCSTPMLQPQETRGHSLRHQHRQNADGDEQQPLTLMPTTTSSDTVWLVRLVCQCMVHMDC